MRLERPQRRPLLSVRRRERVRAVVEHPRDVVGVQQQDHPAARQAEFDRTTTEFGTQPSEHLDRQRVGPCLLE